MSNGPLLFLGVLVTLATSFWGLILAPQIQFGRQQPVVIPATGEYYPAARPGLAEKGADVYRSLGCIECHSQQVRQTGVNFDVWVTELATNMSLVVPAVAKARPELKEAELSQQFSKLPARLATGLPQAAAEMLATQLTDAGAKAKPSLVTLGPDIERKWGVRMSVAQDYLRDYPVQLGQLRLGPDLANYGIGRSNTIPILQHLYRPQPRSMMPPYRFLFEVHEFSAETSVPPGGIVIAALTPGGKSVWISPKEEAKALADYLLSLKSEASLFEAPVGSPPVPAPAVAAAPTAP